MLDPTKEISSMINHRLDSSVLRMLSLSCVRGWVVNLDIPGSVECTVIPWMLKVATSVGAVSNTDNLRFNLPRES